MKKIVLLICFICLIISCGKVEEPKQKIRDKKKISTINLSNLKKKNYHIDSVYENFRYIKLESTTNSLIGKYDKIKFENDTIYVLEKSNSQQCIFAFNTNGKFLFKIDAKGRGPGEYIKIDDFYINTSSKYIGVLSNSKILKYSFNGEAVGELNFKDQYVSNIQFSNNYLYLHKAPYCDTKSCFAFSMVDSNNGSIVYDDYPENKDIAHFPYKKGNYLANDSENVFTNFLYNDTIYLATKNHLQPRFLLDFGKSKFPKNDFNKLLSEGDNFSLINLYKRDYTGLGLNYFTISKNYLFLLFNKGMDTYTTLYSVKTGKSKIFNGFYYQKNVLMGSGITRVNEKTFCSVVDITEAIRLKREDEHDSVLDSLQSFDSRRIRKFNFLKELKTNDNNVLVLFDVKDF